MLTEKEISDSKNCGLHSVQRKLLVTVQSTSIADIFAKHVIYILDLNFSWKETRYDTS